MTKIKETEKHLIEMSGNGPVTVKGMVEQLKTLGVIPGNVLLVHASLRAMGWVCGGVQAVIEALQHAVTPEGTLIFPAYTGWNSDPEKWGSPPVPASWIEVIREHLPAYDVRTSPTYNVGILAEYFRNCPDVQRSAHPRASFTAWGKHAELVTRGHALDYPFGESSPLARAYDLDAKLLLAGVNYEYINSWYLAASRSKQSKTMEIECQALVFEQGKRIWKNYRDVKYKANKSALGKVFEDSHVLSEGEFGYAPCKLISQRNLVDFAVQWFDGHVQEKK